MYNTNYVYGFQNDSKATNNLIIVNDGIDFKDSGIVIGSNTSNPNFRLSYNTAQGTSRISSSILSIDSPFIKMPFLSNANPSVQYNYLVVDASGNITTGQKQYSNDINTILNTIQNNITNINTQLASLQTSIQEIDPNQIVSKLQFSRTWITILIVIVSILVLLAVFFLIQWFRTMSLVKSFESRLEKVEMDLGESTPIQSSSILRPIIETPIKNPVTVEKIMSKPILSTLARSNSTSTNISTIIPDNELNENDYML